MVSSFGNQDSRDTLMLAPWKASVSSICLLLCVLFWATLTKMEAKSGNKGGSIAVSGCLQQGKVVDRFLLTSADGKAYALRSTAVNLSGHIGHNVSIKGRLKRDQKRDEYDFEGSEINEEYGKGKIIDPVDVEVASLKMVSVSCR